MKIKKLYYNFLLQNEKIKRNFQNSQSPSSSIMKADTSRNTARKTIKTKENTFDRNERCLTAASENKNMDSNKKKEIKKDILEENIELKDFFQKVDIFFTKNRKELVRLQEV